MNHRLSQLGTLIENLWRMFVSGFGFHHTSENGWVRISGMTDTHLTNSINYGKTWPHPYWDKVVPLFEAEQNRRLS